MASSRAVKARISPVHPIRLYCEKRFPVDANVNIRKITQKNPTPAPREIKIFPMVTWFFQTRKPPAMTDIPPKVLMKIKIRSMVVIIDWTVWSAMIPLLKKLSSHEYASVGPAIPLSRRSIPAGTERVNAKEFLRLLISFTSY